MSMWPSYVTSWKENLLAMNMSQKNKEWKGAMIKEYQLIVKNDVWEIVSRLEISFS